MKDEIKELLEQLNYAIAHSEEPKKAKKYYDAVIDLQQRIDKAIEYVENENTDRFNNPTYEFALELRKNKLLNILQGSDE